jgi:hypothetical protein
MVNEPTALTTSKTLMRHAVDYAFGDLVGAGRVAERSLLFAGVHADSATVTARARTQSRPGALGSPTVET